MHTGTRTDGAHRRLWSHLVVAVTATAVAGAGLAAAPSAAVPAVPGHATWQDDRTGARLGAAQPAVPVTTRAVPTGTTPAPGEAGPADTEVRAIEVRRAGTAARSATSAPHGRLVVARLKRRSTEDFSLVGITWRRGSAPAGTEVQVRTHGERGWTRWSELHFHPDEGPAPGEEAGETRDGTEPLWVGTADGVDVRVLGSTGAAPADLEVTMVDPGVVPDITSTASTAGTTDPGSAASAAPAVLRGAVDAAAATTVASRRPRLVTRRQWGADPRLRSRCDSPRRARTVEMVFVHHTAGSNRYSRRESPAIVRSVYAYHTQGQGWCDIGYNFLVDRFGTVYVGRSGGLNTPVRGAHSGDYNARTVGISLMGNFDKRRPSRAMKRGLTRLVAWKLSSYYRRPLSRARVSGRRFHKISGHRDAMSTACPGRHVYDWLPKLRRRVARRMDGVQTPIWRKWQRLRRHGTNLGQPYRGEARAPGRGRRTQFDRGWIYWKRGPGAHPVKGAILRRYRTYHMTRGRLGYPTSDVWSVRRRPGVGQSFQHGRIFRTRRHGTTAVWGRIDRRYRKLHSAAGRLGLPVRNQFRVRRGWRVRFQHGRITWNTRTGRVTVRRR
jgi:N-acetylmuramoyl-L-alanine amidase/LGFP repeat